MRVIFLGPPGSGKGTQAKRVMDRFSIPQLSPGDLLRQAAREGTPLGKEAEGYMKAGKLVPDELVDAMILRRIRGVNFQSGFLLDGFPRTVAQAEHLSQAMEEEGMRLDAVVNLELDHEVIIHRLEGRRVCPKGHGEWHVEFNPPAAEGKCDTCSEALIQRADDIEEHIRTRLDAYARLTRPVIAFYEKLGHSLINFKNYKNKIFKFKKYFVK